jgi:predicted N-acetyltransferase YhbS
MRVIKMMEEKYRLPALDLVEAVFTAHSDAEEGKLVRTLVEEIRSKRFYLPELELVMVDEKDEVIGFANFARFHLGGKYENELLLLSPVAVKTELQRQHISKD